MERQSSEAGAVLQSEDELGDALSAFNRGDKDGSDRLFSLLYEELHDLAHRHMRRQARQHTLQPTVLISEAYLRIFLNRRGSEAPPIQDRGHFLRLASRVMRTVLVDHARHKGRRKRHLTGKRLPLEIVSDAYDEKGYDVLELHAALEKLEKVDPRAGQVLELHLFGGRREEETAEILEIGLRTVQRDKQYAMAFLALQMHSH